MEKDMLTFATATKLSPADRPSLTKRRPFLRFLGWALPILFFLAGGAYFLLCFAIFAGASLPYQDAPPALALRQQREIEEAQQLMSTGLVAIVSGTAVLAARIGWWAWRRRTQSARLSNGA